MGALHLGVVEGGRLWPAIGRRWRQWRGREREPCRPELVHGEGVADPVRGSCRQRAAKGACAVLLQNVVGQCFVVRDRNLKRFGVRGLMTMRPAVYARLRLCGDEPPEMAFGQVVFPCWAVQGSVRWRCSRLGGVLAVYRSNAIGFRGSRRGGGSARLEPYAEDGRPLRTALHC